jgi:hypothetical protein
MPYMVWESLLNSPQPTSAGTPLANSTTLTDISVAPQFVLPANFLQGGSAMRFTAFGVFSTTATPTLLLGVYYGGVAGTALASTGAIATGSAVTNVPWRLELVTTIRTVGSSGTAISQGTYNMGTSVSAWNSLPIPNTALATVTVDTTAAKALTIGAQWSAASASNTVTLHGFQIESLGA